MSAPRHVVITRAGTGIGRAIALRLAASGDSLTLLGRRIELLEQTARDLPAGIPIHVDRCDIRDGAEVNRAFDAAAKEIGPIHVLVANAGLGGENHPGMLSQPLPGRRGKRHSRRS